MGRAAGGGGLRREGGPRYLIRDRDACYGSEFRRRIQSLGVKEVITAPRSPWQNAFAERLIGSIRRECLDHVVVLNERHLRRLLKKYVAYYHGSRTHLALKKDAPEPRAVMSQGRSLPFPRWVDCTTVMNAAWRESGELRVSHAESIGHCGEAKAALSGLAAHGRSNQPQTHAT
jgi:hypothetical protein